MGTGRADPNEGLTASWVPRLPIRHQTPVAHVHLLWQQARVSFGLIAGRDQSGVLDREQPVHNRLAMVIALVATMFVSQGVIVVGAVLYHVGWRLLSAAFDQPGSVHAIVTKNVLLYVTQTRTKRIVHRTGSCMSASIAYRESTGAVYVAWVDRHDPSAVWLTRDEGGSGISSRVWIGDAHDQRVVLTGSRNIGSPPWTTRIISAICPGARCQVPRRRRPWQHTAVSDRRRPAPAPDPCDRSVGWDTHASERCILVDATCSVYARVASGSRLR